MCYAVDLTDRLTRGLLCHVQWFSTYSRLLSNYMRRDKGIGMDLTLVHHPLFPCFVAANECCGTINSTTLLPRFCAVEARGSLELESSQSGTKQPVNAQQTFRLAFRQAVLTTVSCCCSCPAESLAAKCMAYPQMYVVGPAGLGCLLLVRQVVSLVGFRSADVDSVQYSRHSEAFVHP